LIKQLPPTRKSEEENESLTNVLGIAHRMVAMRGVVCFLPSGSLVVILFGLGIRSSVAGVSSFGSQGQNCHRLGWRSLTGHIRNRMDQ
jgi:hypothetical protein